MTVSSLFELLRNGDVKCPDLVPLARGFVEDQIAKGPHGWVCHPLGFFVSKHSLSEDMELRLHVWPDGWALPDGQTDADLHDHIFALSSLVLLGAISNDTFEMIVDARGDFRTIEVAYFGNTSGGSALSVTPFRLDQQTAAIHRSGEVYHVAAGVVHRGGAVSTPAVTLLATQKDPKVSVPRILIPKESPLPPAFSRDMPDQGQWGTIVAVAELVLGSMDRW